MKRLFLVLIGISFLYITSYSCDCSRINRDSAVSIGLRDADIVFYGELIEADTINWTYQFRILELFKSNYKSELIKGKLTTSCSVRMEGNGLWIVYSNFEDDSTISISSCSPSVSLNRAEGLQPPVPSIAEIYKDYSNPRLNLLEFKVFELENRVQGISNWYRDLEKLRKYKIVHTTTKKNFDFKNILVISLILLNLVLLILLIKKNARHQQRI